jgi:hypothetical protein
MMLFSLDAFNGIEPFNIKLVEFLMHNIPVYIIIIFLIIAWKWEIVGGILLILISIYGTVFFHSFSGNPGSITVIAPFFLEGLLFIFHKLFFFPKKNKEPTTNI